MTIERKFEIELKDEQGNILFHQEFNSEEEVDAFLKVNVPKQWFFVAHGDPLYPQPDDAEGAS